MDWILPWRHQQTGPPTGVEQRPSYCQSTRPLVGVDLMMVRKGPARRCSYRIRQWMAAAGPKVPLRYSEQGQNTWRAQLVEAAVEELPSVVEPPASTRYRHAAGEEASRKKSSEELHQYSLNPWNW